MQCVRLVPLLSILVPTTPSQLIIDIYPTPILASRTCGKSGAARAMDSHCGTGSMLSFGPFISSTAILAYLMDTHSANSLHVITLNDFARYMLTYGTTFFANSLVLSAASGAPCSSSGCSWPRAGSRRSRCTCTGSVYGLS